MSWTVRSLHDEGEKMTYYKLVEAGYILSIGTVDRPTENEITETEYNEIFSVIRNKPPTTETTDYRLREDLTWEAYPVDLPDPDPEIDDSELLDILMGATE